MQAQQNDNKRPSLFKRQLLVEPVFQRRVTWLFLLSSFAGMMSFIGGWLMLGLHFFHSLASILDAVPEENRLDIYNSWNQVFITSTVLCGVFSIGLVFLSLLFSNKVAGPIHRADLDMKKMIETGELQEIKVRKDDFFRDHIEVINNLISTVKSRRS